MQQNRLSKLLKTTNKHQLLILMFFFAFALRLLITFFHLSDPTYSIQQDGYAVYAEAIRDGIVNTNAFAPYERSLMPGYPILIILVGLIIPSYVYAGLIISILSSLLVSYLVLKITKNFWLTAFTLFFPPMWLEQAGEVSVEPIFVCLSLFGIYAFFQKKYFWSGILIGLAFDVRLIGVSLFAALILSLLTTKRQIKIVPQSIGFLIPILALLLSNYLMYGAEGILEQFTNSERYGGLRPGFIQLAQDFYRAIDWGQYKLFISGTLYVLTTALAFIVLFYFRHKTKYSLIFFYWMLFSIIFILSASPYTLLDNFGRYSLAFLPAYCLGLLYFLQWGMRKIQINPDQIGSKLTNIKSRVKSHIKSRK